MAIEVNKCTLTSQVAILGIFIERMIMKEPHKVVVVGGGAAGFFGAIAHAEAHPENQVILLERTPQVLAKVRISGGGRCNVTHACFDPARLVSYYPRGEKALRGPFSRFQPKNTVEWFEQRGVPLKTEEDGRIFPLSDNSESIISCLMREANKLHVDLRTEQSLNAIHRLEKGFNLQLGADQQLYADKLLIATGSSPKIFALLAGLGHTIVPPVPSLFTFNVPDSPLLELAGVAVPHATLKIEGTTIESQTGALLITHWGFSGPAVLRLSAWGARQLHALNYKATLAVNWLPEIKQETLREQLLAYKSAHGTRQVSSDSPVNLPRNLWKKLVSLAGIEPETRWAMLPKKELQMLLGLLQTSRYQINGKTTFKEEFVTCGGVSLEEVNFKTMESRLVAGLHFAGEVLDIDGVTGGFNFQNAWTTSWIAGNSM
jgi:predicted Rossmann fold flavoprotein